MDAMRDAWLNFYDFYKMVSVPQLSPPHPLGPGPTAGQITPAKD